MAEAMLAGVKGSPLQNATAKDDGCLVGEETKCQTGTESRGRAIGRNFFPVHPLKSVTSNRQCHTALHLVPVKSDFNVQNPVGPKGVSNAHMSPQRDEGHSCHSKPALEVIP